MKKKGGEKSRDAPSKKRLFKFLNLDALRVEDVLFILLLITGIILLLGFLGKKELLSAYFAKVSTSPIYYFDLVVRNGIFKYLYFAFLVALIYWGVKKILKKKMDVKIKAGVIVLGLVVAYIIYLLPPYYLGDYEPLPSSFWPYPEDSEINQTDVAWCGDRVDFLFSPSSQLALKELPVVQTLRDQGMPINIFCIGDRWINDDILCKEKYGLDPREGEKLRNELGLGRTMYSEPQLVVGCKYWIVLRQNVTETNKFICDKTEIC